MLFIFTLFDAGHMRFQALMTLCQNPRVSAEHHFGGAVWESPPSATREVCGCRAPQSQTGFRLEAVTVRKLEFENDAFAFGDKLVEKWYETVEQGGKKGVLVVVTTGKDGALTGGPDFMKACSS